MIVAMGPKGEIGLNNKLLWHLPEDLKNFKKITTGKSIVMGRKTFESIGRALPNRRNIVLSRDVTFHPENVEVISDPLAAFEKALEFDDSESSELIIIGGAEIYKIFLPFAQKLYMSLVDYHGAADAFFPAIDTGEWKESLHQKFDKFEFKILEKK